MLGFYMSIFYLIILRNFPICAKNLVLSPKYFVLGSKSCSEPIKSIIWAKFPDNRNFFIREIVLDHGFRMWQFLFIFSFSGKLTLFIIHSERRFHHPLPIFRVDLSYVCISWWAVKTSNRTFCIFDIFCICGLTIWNFHNISS